MEYEGHETHRQALLRGLWPAKGAAQQSEPKTLTPRNMKNGRPQKCEEFQMDAVCHHMTVGGSWKVEHNIDVDSDWVKSPGGEEWRRPAGTVVKRW